MIEFWDKLKRCYLCDESWFSTYNFNIGWYYNFNKWVRDGNCSRHPNEMSHFNKVIPPDMFYDCYFEWMDIRIVSLGTEQYD